MDTQTGRAAATDGQTTEVRLQVGGMTCASCVRRVEKALATVPGVAAVSVNLATEQATVLAGPEVTAPALAAAVRRAGYEVPLATATLRVEDMTCASCVGRVEKALLKVPGVTAVSVNLATERATVERLASVPVSALVAAVGKAGYAAHDASVPVKARAAARLPDWWPVALAAVLTVPLVAPMLLQWLGIAWMLGGWAQLALATPYSSAWAGASTAPAGRRCAPAPATWICWWPWAPRPPTACRSTCSGNTPVTACRTCISKPRQR